MFNGIICSFNEEALEKELNIIFVAKIGNVKWNWTFIKYDEWNEKIIKTLGQTSCSKYQLPDFFSKNWIAVQMTTGKPRKFFLLSCKSYIYSKRIIFFYRRHLINMEGNTLKGLWKDDIYSCYITFLQNKTCERSLSMNLWSRIHSKVYWFYLNL